MIIRVRKKLERFSKIKTLLKMQSEASTVREIYEGLIERLGLEISRKTIERDLFELVELKEVSIQSECPARFMYVEPLILDGKLSTDEMQLVLAYRNSIDKF